jgi:hypothetical protein
MKVLTGTIAIVLEATHHLCPGSMSLAYGNSWLSIINGVSVTVATFALFQFIEVIKSDLTYIQSCSC